jgi:hypothetical protein
MHDASVRTGLPCCRAGRCESGAHAGAALLHFDAAHAVLSGRQDDSGTAAMLTVRIMRGRAMKRNVIGSWAQRFGAVLWLLLRITVHVESWTSLWIFVDAGGNGTVPQRGLMAPV